MKNQNVKKLAVTALLVAMEIVLARFLSIQTPILRISMGFIPIALTGMLYGPLYAGIGAGIADIIGVALFPAGPFFPGFTLTAALSGVVYGAFLHNRENSLWRICAAAIIVTLGLQLGLDTLWLKIITGKAYLALLPPRVLKAALMAPVQIVFIRIIASERFYAIVRRGVSGAKP